MDIKYTQLKQDKIAVHMPVNHFMCNTIKQIMANYIDTYAIERVVVYENDSVITSDMLSQRLGLVVVRLDPKLITKRELKFVLNITSQEDLKIIYTNDLVFVPSINDSQEDSPLYNKQSQDLLEQDIPLSILSKGQTIQIEAYAIVSNGIDHSKWSPVCAPTFIQKSKNECDLIIESRGSKNPIDIYNESIDVLVDQLLNVAVSI